MKIFNKTGNEAYVILVKEMIRSPRYPNNYEKDFKKSFQKIINDEKNLINLEGSKDLKIKDFENRLEFGKSLYSVLQDCSFSKIAKNEYLWNYITCFYLDKLISSKSNKENRLIWMPKFFDYKRNLARTAWFLYYVNKENSLFALCNPLNEHSNMCEQYVSRQELVRNSAVAEICMKLYYNPETKKLRKNAAKHEKDEKLDGWHPGVIYPRLTKAVNKLNKIYDLWSVEVNDLEKLIGKEFKIWEEVK